MICPLLRRLKKDHKDYQMCMKIRCAWWIKDTKQCAIKELAMWAVKNGKQII